jgi:hypothetical protein
MIPVRFKVSTVAIVKITVFRDVMPYGLKVIRYVPPKQWYPSPDYKALHPRSQ